MLTPEPPLPPRTVRPTAFFSRAAADFTPQASASRAANPYLQKESKEQFKEFTELVEPRRVAQGLMSILNQLSAEWSTDLRYAKLAPPPPPPPASFSCCSSTTTTRAHAQPLSPSSWPSWHLRALSLSHCLTV